MDRMEPTGSRMRPVLLAIRARSLYRYAGEFGLSLEATVSVDGVHDSTIIKSTVFWVARDTSQERRWALLARDIFPPLLYKLDAYNVNYRHWDELAVRNALLDGEREFRMSFDEAW